MPDITRSVIIVVGDVGKNSYGDLTFTDKEGNNYKIGKARIEHFEKVIQKDMGVQLNWADNPHKKGQEYIYSAVQVKDNLPVVEPAKKVIKVQEFKDRQDSREVSIERQVAIKEIGECYRAGKIDDSSVLVIAYMIWLQTQLHIEIGEALGEKQKPATELKLSPDAPESISGGIEGKIGIQVSNIPEFANAGQFFKWCKEIYPSKMPSWIKTTVGLTEKPTCEQLKQAAITLTNMGIYEDKAR